MAKEIERKFLVDMELWPREGRKVKMEQAYLVIEKDRVIRVRIANEKAFITIKGNLKGITRDEFEYEIPVDDATQLMRMSVGAVIVKNRFVFEFEGKVWEIDEFEGENKGLVVAEIELESEDEIFVKPDWVLEEVSHDARYYNFQLSNNPFQCWQ